MKWISDNVWTYTDETADDLLPKRNPAGNKGSFGKISIAAGSKNMAGAAILAAESSYRMGAGMVRIVSPESNRIILQERIPEALLSIYEDENPSSVHKTVEEALCWSDVALVGPGLGRTLASREVVSTILRNEQKGLVIDADAIRLIADHKELSEALKAAGMRVPIILTPHMAECAALLHTNLIELRNDLHERLCHYVNEFHVTVLCKDAISTVATFHQDKIYHNISGNDGLATAGSGDVLAGMTAAVLAAKLLSEKETKQNTDASQIGYETACAASWLHGRAADLLAQSGNRRAIMAGDLKDVFYRL